MKISHSKQRQIGIALTYIQMAFSILINIVCTPIILNKLGQSEYGLYNLTSSIISYLSLLTLGFGASYIRFYSRYKSQNDEEGIKKLNGLYMIVFLIMGVIALVAGLVLSFNAKILFNSTYSSKELHTAKILMLLLTFNMALSFPMSVYTSIISSQEEFAFQKLVNIGKTVISPAISIIVIFFGYGSIGMVVTTTIMSLIIDFINIFYCHKKLKVKFKFGKIDGWLLKEIAVFSFFIAINQLIDQLNMQTDKVILGKMINASAVAIYAVASTIQLMYLNFSTAINSVFAPKIHKIINSGKDDSDNELTDLFIKIGRVQYFILMLIMTGFVFFGKYFVQIWAGEGYEIAYYLVLILMVPSTVPLIQNIGIEIQRAKNKHQFRSLVYLLVAVINVVISIILCKYYGIVGVTVGTAFANIVGCIIIMNIYYHKKIGLNIIKFWKSIARASLGLVIPVMTGSAIMYFVKFNNALIYLSFVAIYSIIYLISIYFLGMRAEEKMFIKKCIKPIISLLIKTPKKVSSFFRRIFRAKKFILIYSHYVVMDSYIMQYYNNIKELDYKIKFIFLNNDNNGGTSVDKDRYKKYGIPSKMVIKSKMGYFFSNPDLFVAADLYPLYSFALACKKLQLDHRNGMPTVCLDNQRGQVYIYTHKSFNKNKPPFDLYLEPSKLTLDAYNANEPLFKGKIWFSGNKLNNKYDKEKFKYDEYRKQLGINENQKVVALFGTWNRTSLFHKLGNSIFEELKKLAKNDKYKFIVSIHPKEYTKYSEYVEPLGCKVDELADYGIIVRKPGEDAFPFIVSSDIIIADHSSIGEDAIMCDKKIIYSDFPYDNICMYSAHELLRNRVPILKDAKDLKNCIEDEYPSKAYDALQSIKSDTYADGEFYKEQCIKATKFLLND